MRMRLSAWLARRFDQPVAQAIAVSAVTFAGFAAIAAAATLGGIDAVAADGPTPIEAVVDAGGKLRVPADYRTEYEYLGTWAVAKSEGAGSEELHVVYASPGTIGAYLKNGGFPDGAVLVKEVFGTATADMTTGTVSSSSTLKGWFLMVRDVAGAYPAGEFWGDGWGWAWFEAASPATPTPGHYKEACIPCHEPAKATHWIYVEGYPPLKR